VLTATVEGGDLAEHDSLSRSVPWWSLAKTTLAAGALALVAEGRLALDASLRDRPFSLRQLLQHTSGLPDYGGLVAYHEAVARNDEPWVDGELLRRVGAERLLFAPGAGWAYSNVGYLFVRQIIERAMDTELDYALHALVFDPIQPLPKIWTY
jgi:CubicO group peptidase (beta-lactamase class C family)